jgi:hypothetical protein
MSGFRFQRWLCIEGFSLNPAQDNFDIIMPRGQWQDTSHLKGYRLEVAVAKISGCELHLESSLDPDVSAMDTGNWSDVLSAAVTAEEDRTYAVSNCSEQAEHKGGGMLRWRIRPTAAAEVSWKICFHVRLFVA